MGMNRWRGVVWALWRPGPGWGSVTDASHPVRTIYGTHVTPGRKVKQKAAFDTATACLSLITITLKYGLPRINPECPFSFNNTWNGLFPGGEKNPPSLDHLARIRSHPIKEKRQQDGDGQNTKLEKPGGDAALCVVAADHCQQLWLINRSWWS